MTKPKWTQGPWMSGNAIQLYAALEALLERYKTDDMFKGAQNLAVAQAEAALKAARGE